jgi:FkbM family methyltransferase
MKVFIDLGAYNGDTINKAKKTIKNIDKYYAFEPYPDSFNVLKKNYETEDVICINKAVGIRDETNKMFLHKKIKENPSYCVGNSLIKYKLNTSDEFIEVQTIDFNKFIETTFEEPTRIILKVDIEGSEYELFNHLITSTKIKLIEKIYCEWHWYKIGLSIEEHKRIVDKLNEFGFNLTGNKNDIFS